MTEPLANLKAGDPCWIINEGQWVEGTLVALFPWRSETMAVIDMGGEGKPPFDIRPSYLLLDQPNADLGFATTDDDAVALVGDMVLGDL
jgi:hypothetical protein